ncbi:MAG: nitroreductase family deazaflavin-dependent oxidoreductase [Chloroflexota bacterium]|nr:nitroreductase family deazaflavin-dependent oxidoreductase [Chloroflexota bacterium]
MIPPRWVFRIGWAFHRALFAASAGRIGAKRPAEGKLGTLFLSTTGRKSGQVRRNALFCMADGPNLVVVASNAGADVDPAWWLNLQARPDAEVELGVDRRPVRARAATVDEHARLWPRIVVASPGYDEYRRGTSRPITVVILEPLTGLPG